MCVQGTERLSAEEESRRLSGWPNIRDRYSSLWSMALSCVWEGTRAERTKRLEHKGKRRESSERSAATAWFAFSATWLPWPITSRTVQPMAGKLCLNPKSWRHVCSFCCMIEDTKNPTYETNSDYHVMMWGTMSWCAYLLNMCDLHSDVHCLSETVCCHAAQGLYACLQPEE